MRTLAAVVAAGLVTAGAVLVFLPAGLVVGGGLLGAWALLSDDGTPPQ
jgi:hypothetical protein